MLDSSVDYDTALHVAAAKGHLAIVKFLANFAIKTGRKQYISIRDRWGTTPLGLAIAAKNKQTEGVLRAAGGDEIGNLSAARSRILMQ